jgi:hypothetical protein
MNNGSTSNKESFANLTAARYLNELRNNAIRSLVVFVEP